MKTLVSAAALIALAPGATFAGADVPAGPHATALTLPDDPFRDPQVVATGSMPPQFAIVLTREMPSSGWSVVVDSVDVDEASGRIVAKVSEIAPADTTAQVITSVQCRLRVGTLRPGSYLLEMWRRRGSSGPHGLAQGLVVVAR